ncbi:MAG TPA: amino acid ABC transporter permease [Patescibacteria group bacterium]|nr:amino acid ABC transporter permease [Patescibacteria group bacterium]
MAGLFGGPGDSGDLLGLGDAPGPLLVHPRPSTRRANLIAAISTIVFFTVLGLIVVNAPGWPQVRVSFFNGQVFADSWPLIVRAFWVNVRLFVTAELLILPFGLLIAILRSLPGPVFLPLRILATIYADVFRALPGVLVIFMLGFGIPGLGLAGVPVDPFFYAVVALTLIYSAYVSEVYRAGIDSVHPSQDAAARSLGLSRFQSLRHVVLPQAVRRVIPPLLNDFIGLQKDTVLVSFIGVVEVFRQSQIRQAGSFNFTPYIATALIFLVVTIPLARLTDVLIARDRRRSAASAR